MKVSALVRSLRLGIAAFTAVAGLVARGVVREVASTNDASAEGGAIGGDIVYRFTMDDGSIEYAHVFTSTNTDEYSATFTIPANSAIARKTFRLLAVGGGGSGGNDCGGGGGAGGLFMDDAYVLAPGEYAISVGAGAPVWADTGTNHHGESGEETTITLGKTALVRVLGGGGGGTWNSASGRAGSAGASGGGGSSVANNGGSSTQEEECGYGLGNAGGGGLTPSSGNELGGGGGGAGGSGEDATATSAGNGGPGIASDITGESVVYAAGGGGAGYGNFTRGYGGGDSTNTYGDGGDGSRDGVSGAPSTGSGGGGGGRSGHRKSGGGADGIVVIRYTIPVSQGIGDDVVTGEADGQTYFTFGTNGTFRVLGAVKARVLAVGGGGAGGNYGDTAEENGAGAGGGAGGLVDSELYFSAGTYNVVVGAGAPANTRSAERGDAGMPSYIYIGAGTTNIFAYGGGGGGIGGYMWDDATGSEGGSGGGGSYIDGEDDVEGSAALQPGSAWGGYGFAGGTGRAPTVGAGGGGAGGAGSDAIEDVAGAGGAGYPCDITGALVAYACGGGGASCNGAGGSGGDTGGTGAGATSRATAGTVNTGAGGGGGNDKYPDGAAGGSGVIIIRVLAERTEPFEKPASNLGSIAFDGTREYTLYTDYDPDFQTITGDVTATDVGTYTFTVTLAEGLAWSDGTTAPVTCTWSVTKAELAVTGFNQPGWQQGEVPSMPVVNSTPTLDSSWVRYDISSDNGTTWAEWEPGTTLATGSYRARLVVFPNDSYTIPSSWTLLTDGSGGYVNSSSVSDFAVVEYNDELGFPSYLGYHTVFTVTVDPGETLIDFPMLLHIDASVLPGFYRNSRPDHADIRFTLPNEPNAPLPFEIDTWNPEGESLIWVKMPEYALGKQVIMSWGEIVETNTDGVTYTVPIPSNPDESVWSDYAGVWHFNEDVTVNDAAAGVVAADSSPYKLDAIPTILANKGDLSVMVSTNGPIGNARVNGVYVNNTTDYTWFKVPDFVTDNELIEQGFTFSGWLKATQYTGNPPFVSAKTATSSNAAGWEIKLNNNPRSSVLAYGYGTTANPRSVTFSSQSNIRNYDFFHLTAAYTNTTLNIYAHSEWGGHHETTVAISAPTAATGLAFGGNLAEARTFWGFLDEFRVRKGVVSAAWAAAEYAQSAGTCSPGIIYTTPESTFLNRWYIAPTVTPTLVQSGSEITVFEGEGLYGADSAAWHIETFEGANLGQDLASLQDGSYLIVFDLPAGGDGDDATRTWTGLSTTFTVTVRIPHPTYRLGDAAEVTRLGRILLANDDANATQPVEGQAYYLTAANVAGDNATYWAHESESASGYANLKSATVSTLKSMTPVDELCGSTDIWHLEDVRIGNIYDYVEGSRQTSQLKNYLPQAKTAKAISSADGASGSLDESAHLVMRNVENAAIYSPCYTNGIGSIYFDAVNGWTTHTSGESEIFRIVVEVCTSSTAGDIPSDENLRELVAVVDDDGNQTGAFTTNRFAHASTWQPVEMTAIKIVNGLAVSTEKTTELALDIETGGAVSSFYRVFVDHETLGIREPVRFRIRRSGVNTSTLESPDGDTLILVDNIEVSPPPSRADLSPLGNYDSTKGGSQVTGWGGAFEIAFPSVTSGDIYARMEPEYYTNYLANVADSSDLVVSAMLHYRWRYLGQSYVPEDGETWKSAPLKPSDGFRSVKPLDVPRYPGDIEFWTEMALSANFYRYCDYTGLGIGTPGYTEEIAFVTNRCSDTSVTTKTRGTDWFVRIRSGASSWDSLGITVIGVDGVTNDTQFATLHEDNIWRCYFKTLTNETGTVKFRIDAFNRQTDGDRAWQTNHVTYAVDPTSVSDAANQEGVLTGAFVARDEFADSDWYPLEIDAKTGYLMFQLDETAQSITVVHADYQNFNLWSTSATGDGTFVGTFKEGEDPTAGSSNEKQSFDSDFSTWNDMPATSAYWRETFTSETGIDTSYFQSHTTYNGWTAGYGKIIYETFAAGSARALQMHGEGQGYVQYVSSGSTLPRGIDTLSFTTRIVNSIGWDDISYYDADGMTSLQNYTFVAGVKGVTNATDKLPGAYSFSLVANYRPKKGCYEFRYVQTSENVGTLQLWKWAKVGASRPTAYFLGSGHWSGLANSTGLASTDMARWAKMAISVTNVSDGVVKVIGAINAESPAITDERYGGATEASQTVKCYAIEFTDSGDVGGPALTKGTMGVVSANCPARFYVPRYYTQALDDSAGIAGTADAGSLTDYGFKAFGASFLITFPAGTKGPYQTLGSEKVNDDCDYDEWAMSERMVTANISGANGIQAVAPRQTLGIFLAPGGTTAYGNESVTNVVVSSFSTNNTSLVLRTADDCSLMIRTVGDDNATEVVIDNIEMSQWRGENWSALDSTIITKKPTSNTDAYAWTNFTFTTCWVTNNTVLMSARRTSTNSLCSIVSPLMDGWTYRGGYKAGTGLGQISFSFHGAQTNACITVQAYTNSTDINQGEAYSYAWSKNGGWVNITNFTFETESEGIRSCYVGMRDVHGLLRLVIDDALVEDVAEIDDPTAFGEIYIDSVTVYDEPAIDFRSWWGWNVRTVGDYADSEGRMLLGDVSEKSLGQSVALNNSVTSDIVEKDYATYKRHLPFIQSPTFGTNLVGSVAFKARKYAYTAAESAEYATLNARTAFVTLYGSDTGYEDGPWVWLKDFTVTTDTFTDFEYSTSSSQPFKAFRFVVRGVSGTEDGEDYNNSPAEGKAKWDDGFPVRVLLDEIVVTESMMPRVGFRFVGAFRSDMNGTEPVPNVPSESEQPLCKEGWGVQCEIYKAQLPDKIDLESTSNPPKVILHWYVGEDNWGWETWKTNANAKAVALLRADAPEGSEEPCYVFRSSYQRNSDGAESVVPEASASGTLVQYMLEVQFNQFNDEGEAFPATNYLTAADWSTPDWYRPLDYNAGKGSRFSAYTILDAVAPHWAWINEVNIIGEIGEDGYTNSDSDCQYVEVAAPADADLTGWYIQMLAIQGETVITNIAATFGTDAIPGTKDLRFADASNGMIFHVLGSPASQEALGGKLKYTDGTLDGVWTFDGSTSVYNRGDISPFYPIAVQLVRPRGILESEIVAAGTNYFAQYDSEFALQYYPENTMTNLNHLIKGANFIYIGTDDNWTNGIITNSLSVVTNVGGSYACWTNETYDCWTNGVGRTPGRKNINQVIEGTPPSPGGMSRLIFSSLLGGRIWQWDTELNDWTTNDVALYVRRNVETNLLYKVGNWHVLADAVCKAAVSNTSYTAKAVKTANPNEWYVSVGTNIEANLSVTAHAEPDDKVNALLPEDSRYREAILEWLSGSKSLFDEPWDESDELYLAEFRTLNDEKQGELTLEQMYCLDIPPTTSNLWLKGGLWDFKYPYARADYHYEGEELKNYLMGIEMYVTNANPESSYTVNGRRDWSPYVIQSTIPGYTTWDWATYGGYWENATFNLQAKKLNTITLSDPDKFWINLNRFVFDYDSFDENHRSLIEIEDVTSPYSAAYYEFGLMEGEFVDEGDDAESVISPPTPVFRWQIGDALGTDQIKILAPTNYID